MAINVNAPSNTGVPVDWADLTNKPSCFPPCLHGWSHVGTGTDPVPLVTPTDSGLVPAPPTGASQEFYFAGDLAWHSLAEVGNEVVTTAAAGLAPVLPGTPGTYFSGTSPAGYKHVDWTELTNVPPSFPTLWSSIIGMPSTFPPGPHGPTHGPTGGAGVTDLVLVDWGTQIANKPGTFPPSPHAPTHVTGGNDVIAPASTTIAGLLDRLSGAATDYVGGDNACHSLVAALVQVLVPPGAVLDFAGATAPAGFLLADGSAYPTSQYPALFAVIGYTYGGAGANFNVPDSRGRVSVGAGQGAGLSNYALGSAGGVESVTLTAAQIPAHTHPLNDPTHVHPDPGHNHVLNDPTHVHGISQTPHAHSATAAHAINYGTTTPGYPFYEAASANTGAANANVAVNAAATGCYNSAAATGLHAVATGCTVGNNTGGGGSHENRPPYRAYNKIIKT